MTLKELADRVSAESGVTPRDAQRALRGFFSVLDTEIEASEVVFLPGFGRLMKRQTADGKERIVLVRRKAAGAEAEDPA
ncbi:HU family DNA-binding protein [Paroceanicella profunda]|uniref:HU family DNA-binding protein n=1 Tax=Paroceanicella profunda TaxID=2579971 RepID=A0A5B8FYE7_9RHOB|nr:HU family DNA-binding protein [Paroceanicella profunda]QDL91562.1 HU family DNA-binding protein [Paroceanicella profunda]